MSGIGSHSSFSTVSGMSSINEGLEVESSLDEVEASWVEGGSGSAFGTTGIDGSDRSRKPLHLVKTIRILRWSISGESVKASLVTGFDDIGDDDALVWGDV